MTELHSTRRHRAQERLTAWQRAKPCRSEYWRALDKVRAEHGYEWPLYTFLPVPDAGKIIARIWRSHNLQPTTASVLAEEASALAGFGAWRVTQGIYRFDPTLAAALVDTPLTGDLPVSALTHLPHWCVYVETPGRTVPRVVGGETILQGYYAWIN